jgi:ankyrin repeat protein
LKAAYNGHTDIVEMLIEKHDADVSHQDKDGWSALHNACSSSQPSIASTLLDHYADINIISKMGHTPLSKLHTLFTID